MTSMDTNQETCCAEEQLLPVVETAQIETAEEFYLNKTIRSQERLDICKACPELIGPLNNCLQCGCFMNIKVRIYESTCPLGKW
jgi:hypothetical protein